MNLFQKISSAVVSALEEAVSDWIRKVVKEELRVQNEELRIKKASSHPTASDEPKNEWKTIPDEPRGEQEDLNVSAKEIMPKTKSSGMQIKKDEKVAHYAGRISALLKVRGEMNVGDMAHHLSIQPQYLSPSQTWGRAIALAIKEGLIGKKREGKCIVYFSKKNEQ